MNKKLIYILVGAAFLLFVVSLIIYLNAGGESGKEEGESLPDSALEDTEKPELLKLKAFFFKESSWYMNPITYEILPTGAREELYKNFIDLLIRGDANHISPVPDGASLRTLFFVEKTGQLVVDFSEELVNKFPGGTRAELQFIYFIVNNLCYNFKEIKMVKFMVSGNEIKTIAGHIDTENPFYPDFRYLRDR